MFTDEFHCRLYFSDYCKSEVMCRSNQTPLDKICKRCLRVMVDEVDRWYDATKLLKDDGPNEVSFPDMSEELASARQTEIKWTPDRFKVVPELFMRPPAVSIGSRCTKVWRTSEKSSGVDLNETYKPEDPLTGLKLGEIGEPVKKVNRS